MPELEGRRGEDGNQKLINLLESLGWTQRGDSNVDIECTVSYHDRQKPHGIDGYMTYNCPYRQRKRGSIIESKKLAWSSLSESKLRKYFDQTLSALECAPESEEFEEYLDFGESDLINSAVLGIWIHDQENYDHEKFKEYLSNISVPNKRKKPFQVSILANKELKRLSSLSEKVKSLKNKYDGQRENFELFHPALSDVDSKRDDVVPIEEMLSKYVFGKATKMEDNTNGVSKKEISVVFYFDDIKLEALNFMYHALRRYQMVDCDELHIYLYNEDDLQTRSIEREFKRNGVPSEGTQNHEIVFEDILETENLEHYGDPR